MVVTFWGVDLDVVCSVANVSRQSAFPNTTFVIGYDESHDAHLYVEAGSKEGTQSSRELRQWIASRL